MSTSSEVCDGRFESGIASVGCALAILAKDATMEPPKTDEDLIEVAEKIAARRGREEADAFLPRFWQRGREVSEKYPLTDEEAMDLAVSELHAMRAERNQQFLARAGEQSG